ncbi:unnamed protein product [Protopolystoma xenopodis]|uniref:Frizzled/Smoothened transmembrane domain-containing protein n=1 Tax=Protopolystoma xenopodis TaxID=117903 RepID=A0A3S5AZJ9_9PLAT|nr:unnamed protein product [Protopolystoma xenopodis]
MHVGQPNHGVLRLHFLGLVFLFSGSDDVCKKTDESSVWSKRGRKTVSRCLLCTIQQTKVQSNPPAVSGLANSTSSDGSSVHTPAYLPLIRLIFATGLLLTVMALYRSRIRHQLLPPAADQRVFTTVAAISSSDRLPIFAVSHMVAHCLIPLFGAFMIVFWVIDVALARTSVRVSDGTDMLATM